MTDAIFQEIKEELLHGMSEKEHPFRYCTMATVGLDRMARLRTVVLRKVSPDLDLTFFTDRRSKKVVHIKENKKVSALFYHPEKLLQVRVEGIGTVIKEKALLQKYWDQVPIENRIAYTTTQAPGSTLSDPAKLEYLEDTAHFCIIQVHPFKIEYLKLARPQHIRVRFSMESDGWRKDYLVP
tara:strand:+ start:1642 stop:2187 length:546 start_codon:yes stop_codon:yes gene_type:complete